MKILTILTYYHPHWTGLTKHAIKVAEELAGRGHEVTVLAARHSPALPRRQTLHGVRILRLDPIGRFSRGLITPTFPLEAARQIARHDVVHIHTPLPEALLVALICRALNRPLVMTHHGDVVMPSGAGNQLVQRIAHLVLLAAGGLADAVTAYSRDYADHSALVSHFRHKLSCIYPPVDIPAPDPAAVRAWRRELGLSDRVLLGMAGRWVEEKGFDYLLQALPLIRERVPEAQLVYAGEPQVVYEDFYVRCEPLIAAQREHISFVGLLRDPRQLANFYAMCDLIVVPSRTDNMPLVEIEALLSGTPLVTSDIPGARVVVQETGFGRLAPPGDPPGLARTIVETLRDRERYRPSRDAVRSVFDATKTIDAYQQVMERVVASRSASRTVRGRPTRSVSSPSVSPNGVAVARVRDSEREWKSLTARDQTILDGLLRNEVDMAYRRRARVLLDYLELRDGERVLDNGCGMGFYLMAMGRLRDLQLVGIDRDVGRLDWAVREAVPAALVDGDIERLPFRDESFDKVLMTEVVEHLRDDLRGLRDVLRVLRPGGVLAVSVPHADYPFWWDPISKVWTGIGGPPIRSGPLVGIWTNHERLYRPAEIAGRIAEAGFVIETVEEATHHSFPFLHFLVYGVGKPLLESDLLPASLLTSADRFSGEQNSGSMFNPINLGRAAFQAVDRLNDRPDLVQKRTFMNVLVKARKPDVAASDPRAYG